MNTASAEGAGTPEMGNAAEGHTPRRRKVQINIHTLQQKELKAAAEKGHTATEYLTPTGPSSPPDYDQSRVGRKATESTEPKYTLKYYYWHGDINAPMRKTEVTHHPGNRPKPVGRMSPHPPAASA